MYHTNADKANDDGGGHGGEGNWIGGPPAEAAAVDLKEVVPWRLLRITIVWPKLRGNVAAEFLGKFAAANNVVLGLEIETELGCVILPKILTQKS